MINLEMIDVEKVRNYAQVVLAFGLVIWISICIYWNIKKAKNENKTC